MLGGKLTFLTHLTVHRDEQRRAFYLGSCVFLLAATKNYLGLLIGWDEDGDAQW